MTSKQKEVISVGETKRNSNSTENKKKRQLTPEKKDQNKTERNDEPSSQESIILKRNFSQNIPKAKRTKAKSNQS